MATITHTMGKNSLILLNFNLWGSCFVRQPHLSLTLFSLLHITKNHMWHCMRRPMRQMMCSNVPAHTESCKFKHQTWLHRGHNFSVSQLTLFGCNEPTVFLSHTKPAPTTSHSQPAVFFSHNKLAPATSHSQPNRVYFVSQKWYGVSFEKKFHVVA